jgi:hypothetical protein
LKKLLLSFLVITIMFGNSAEAGFLKDSALVIGGVGVKKAFDKYAKNKFFKSEGEVGGKKVYQQEIDPNLVVEKIDSTTGFISKKTNLEKMNKGQAPYIEKDGELQLVELHHSRQKDNGPIFEVSKSTHKAKSGEGGEALHPYGNEKNPEDPVGRKAFNKERPEYWKNRAEDFQQDTEQNQGTVYEQ